MAVAPCIFMSRNKAISLWVFAQRSGADESRACYWFCCILKEIYSHFFYHLIVWSQANTDALRKLSCDLSFPSLARKQEFDNLNRLKLYLYCPKYTRGEAKNL